MSRRAERCDHCRWWDGPEDPNDPDCEDGECHRWPPTPPATAQQYRMWVEVGLPYPLTQGIHPTTHAGDWCGEFARRPGLPLLAPEGLSLEALGLSVRARKASRHAGASDAAGLCRLTAEAVLDQRNTGPTTLREIRERLAAFGLHLFGDTPGLLRDLRIVLNPDPPPCLDRPSPPDGQ